MGYLKAPGPDGFQALFYQKQWSIIQHHVYDMVLKALEGKDFPEGLNDTHIVLIPKVSGPEHMSQFRPISLCNVAYKIVSKTIANRIKKVLPWLISENQSAFVPGRQITDNIVIFQEAIQTMRKKRGKTGYMAIRIDLEKVYNRLKWSFIEETMKDMQFPGLMIDTVMKCVTTPSMQILWNGETTEKFKPTKGVRQGDPLSSYLFVMCLEKLQQAIDVRVRGKDWIPLPMCKNGPRISNLFFADNMVLFAEARADQAIVIKYVLDNFCQASGEKVSMGGNEEHRKVHLLSWDAVQRPKSTGGLGIRSSRQSNADFLTILGWRVLTEPRALWARVIRAKYCNGKCDVDMFQTKPNMSNFWAGITSQAKIINSGSTVAVGNGRKTLFWDHSWVDAGYLSDRVITPVPKSILGATVADMWSESNGWKWEVFSNYLSRNDLLKIATYYLSPEPYLEDSLYWNASSSGKFTIKSALTLIKTADISPETEPIAWHVIWKLLVQQRVHGASKGNPGPAGCRGIIRDESGNFLSAFNFSCGICTSMRAEMRALAVGLEQARALGIRKLLIHMDNRTCVSFIHEEQLLSKSLCLIVQQCINLIKLEGWVVKVDHVFREANRAAD
ncbi:uncharacterized protein LOC141594882 [Silene latifolia]|uniref:uncharacterized protein LOC141594882 n=1 Tax=Silene latifolia TaxID=37657 RepID=UPI003D77138B